MIETIINNFKYYTEQIIISLEIERRCYERTKLLSYKQNITFYENLLTILENLKNDILKGVSINEI